MRSNNAKPTRSPSQSCCLARNHGRGAPISNVLRINHSTVDYPSTNGERERESASRAVAIPLELYIDSCYESIQSIIQINQSINRINQSIESCNRISILR